MDALYYYTKAHWCTETQEGTLRVYSVFKLHEMFLMDVVEFDFFSFSVAQRTT